MATADSARTGGWGPEIPVKDSVLSLPLDAHLDERGNATVLNSSLLASPTIGSFSLITLEKGVPRTLFNDSPATIDNNNTLSSADAARSGMDAGGQVSVAWVECGCATGQQLRAIAVGTDRERNDR